MIIGIGMDLVDIRRIEKLLNRFGPRFTSKVFTSAERAYAEASHYPARAYANRFAAKEATVKALGTGFRGLDWRDIEVLKTPEGRPVLQLHGKAQIRCQELIPQGHQVCFHVSFSDEPPYAAAFLVFSAIKDD